MIVDLSGCQVDQIRAVGKRGKPDNSCQKYWRSVIYIRFLHSGSLTSLVFPPQLSYSTFSDLYET